MIDAAIAAAAGRPGRADPAADPGAAGRGGPPVRLVAGAAASSSASRSTSATADVLDSRLPYELARLVSEAGVPPACDPAGAGRGPAAGRSGPDPAGARPVPHPRRPAGAGPLRPVGAVADPAAHDAGAGAEAGPLVRRLGAAERRRTRRSSGRRSAWRSRWASGPSPTAWTPPSCSTASGRTGCEACRVAAVGDPMSPDALADWLGTIRSPTRPGAHRAAAADRMTAVADQPVRAAGRDGGGVPCCRRAPRAGSQDHPAVPAGRRRARHRRARGWSWTTIRPLVPRRPGWGWATGRPGRGWAVAGAGHLPAHPTARGRRLLVRCGGSCASGAGATCWPRWSARWPPSPPRWPCTR